MNVQTIWKLNCGQFCGLFHMSDKCWKARNVKPKKSVIFKKLFFPSVQIKQWTLWKMRCETDVFNKTRGALFSTIVWMDNFCLDNGPGVVAVPGQMALGLVSRTLLSWRIFSVSFSNYLSSSRFSAVWSFCAYAHICWMCDWEPLSWLSLNQISDSSWN